MKTLLSLFVVVAMASTVSVASADRLPVPKPAYQAILKSAQQSPAWRGSNPRLRVVENKPLNRSQSKVSVEITGRGRTVNGQPVRQVRAVGTFTVNFHGPVQQVGKWEMPIYAPAPPPSTRAAIQPAAN